MRRSKIGMSRMHFQLESTEQDLTTTTHTKKSCVSERAWRLGCTPGRAGLMTSARPMAR